MNILLGVYVPNKFLKVQPMLSFSFVFSQKGEFLRTFSLEYRAAVLQFLQFSLLRRGCWPYWYQWLYEVWFFYSKGLKVLNVTFENWSFWMFYFKFYYEYLKHFGMTGLTDQIYRICGMTGKIWNHLNRVTGGRKSTEICSSVKCVSTMWNGFM